MFNIESLTAELINTGALKVELPLQGRPMIANEVITTANVDEIGEQIAEELTKKGIEGELEYDPEVGMLVLNRNIQ